MVERRAFSGVSVELDAGSFDVERLFSQFPAAATRSASRAINRVMEREVLPLGRAELERQVNFPPGYVDGDRLEITRFANPQQLEGVVTGRGRPTSLARFVQNPGAIKFGRGKRTDPAYTVEVKPGSPQKVGGFFVRLRNGNLGFAIRLRPGEALRGKREATPLGGKFGGDTYLLYGPSVDQVFGDVADDITPEVERALTREFLRLMDVSLNGDSFDGD